MAKRKRGQSAKRKHAGGARKTAAPGASPAAPADAQPSPPPEEAPSPKGPARSKKPEASAKAAKRRRRTAKPRARKAAQLGASSGGEGDALVVAPATPAAPVAPAVEAAATVGAPEPDARAAQAAKSTLDPTPVPAPGPGARLAELACALTAEATRRRGLEERLRDLLGRRGEDVERARAAALLRTEAEAEATLERTRDKGGAEIEALRREFRVAKARLEADLGEAQAHFLRLRADVEERVAEARAEAEAQTRRSLERVLERTERRAEIERKQLTAEIDRLRAELETVRPSAIANAPGASVSTVAAALAAAPQASPPPAKAPPASAPALDDQAAQLADAEERMRRCVLDAERTAREATEELDRVEERLHREAEASRTEVRRLQNDLEEARVEARVAQMLGEALKASRAEIDQLKTQTREFAARASDAAAAALGASLPVQAPPPGKGATGTRLLSVPELEAAGPPLPLPPPPPRRKRGTSTQIIEAGKAAVWQDNAKRMVQVSVGGSSGSDAPRSKVGRMRRAITAADLESDPALKAAAPAAVEDGPLPEDEAALPDAPTTEQPEIATADPDAPLEVDFDPDEWEDL